MLNRDRQEGTWTRWPQERNRAARCWTRAFGVYPSDLSIDFAHLNRPILITRLLSLCLRDAEGQALREDALWSWTLAQRLDGLLAIAQASGERRESLVARCGNRECREPLELDVELAHFVQNNPERTFTLSLDDGATLEVTLPTGSDQLDWLHTPPGEGKAMLLGMAQHLVKCVNGAEPPQDWCLPQEWFEALSAQLEAQDPLTALTLETQCPFCSTDVNVDLDLEALILKRLKQKQAGLLQEIHYLASHYHWSEDVILNLPPWRREYYLTQLGVERAP